MEEKTVKKLNQLNKDFYNTVSGDFDESRDYAWEGWDLLWDKVGNFESILDVGCGNGRFLDSLKEKGWNGSYVGIDSNRALLDSAKVKHKEALFIEKDILDENWGITDKFDFITVFGVMHHIPGKETRRKFLKYIKTMLSEDGFLVATFWDFTQSKSLMSRRVSPEQIGIEGSGLTENDYLLDWQRGEKAVRYCHKYSDDEIALLLTETGFKVVQKFNADGKTGKMNQYLVLQRNN